MSVSLRRCGVTVAQYRPDYRQAVTTGNAESGKAVAKIMQPNVAQARTLAYAIPNLGKPDILAFTRRGGKDVFRTLVAWQRGQ